MEVEVRPYWEVVLSFHCVFLGWNLRVVMLMRQELLPNELSH